MRSFFTNFLEPISYFVTAIGFLFGLRYSNSSRIWALFIFNLAASFLMSLASLKVLPQKNNIVEYDLLLLLAAIVTSVYFLQILKSKTKKIFAITILVAEFANFFRRDVALGKTLNFDSIGFYLISLSIIIMVFMYFDQLLKNVATGSIYTNFDFWIVISFFIYRLGAITIFLSMYALSGLVSNWSDHLMIGNLWAGQNIFLLLSAACLIIGALWVNYRTR